MRLSVRADAEPSAAGFVKAIRFAGVWIVEAEFLSKSMVNLYGEKIGEYLDFSAALRGTVIQWGTCSEVKPSTKIREWGTSEIFVPSIYRLP